MAKPKSNTVSKKRKKRDDFSKPIVRMLREQVNNHCSNPDCGVATLGPKYGDTGANIIGKGAHICAAAPGGARYDPTMTPDQRGGIDNGIWLCANCADRIDRDEKHFTIELLQNWKQMAIARASSNLGKPPRRANEAVELYHQLRTPGGYQRTPIAQIIRDAIEVEEQSLKDLDPRFDVKAAFINGSPVFQLAALEDDVPLQFNVTGPEAENFARLYQRMNDHGHGFHIPLEAVHLDGSPLFDHFMNHPGGTFHIGAQKKPAVHACQLEDPKTGSTIALEPFLGEVRYGVKSVSFLGSTYGGMVRLQYREADPTQKHAEGFSLTFDLGKWEGRPLNYLPYLNPLVQMADALCRGYVIRTELTIEGHFIFRGTLDPYTRDSAFFDDTQAFLRYTELCQQVAKRLGAKVPFREKVTFSDAKLAQLDLINRLLMGEMVERPWPTAPIFTDLRVSDLESRREVNVLLAEPNQTISLSHAKVKYLLFDTEVELPNLHTIFAGVYATQKSKNQNKDDGIVRVEWQRQDASHCYLSFEELSLSNKL